MSIEIIDNSHSLLVSDSNETSQQFDSKKMDYSLLVKLAQDDLFTKHMDVLKYYLTVSKYELSKNQIQRYKDKLIEKWNQLKDQNWSGKYKAVPGQVILVEKSKVPSGWNPLDYVYHYWYIPLGMQIVQIGDCFLRGVTGSVQNNIQKSTNNSVVLTDENIPPHMHLESITQNSELETVVGNVQSQDGKMQPGIPIDMFTTDHIGTGFTNNEIDGVTELLTIQETGHVGYTSHNNVPESSEFYAFEVKSI